jgi:hypothetical protein
MYVCVFFLIVNYLSTNSFSALIKLHTALKIEKVLEQILAVLIQFVKDKKLEHQYQYVSLLMFHRSFLCFNLFVEKWNIFLLFYCLFKCLIFYIG